jgi:hypothetical protein
MYRDNIEEKKLLCLERWWCACVYCADDEDKVDSDGHVFIVHLMLIYVHKDWIPQDLW